VQEGRTLRPESVGPVFSVCGDALHMRYSARARNAQWRADGATQAARAALDRLFSQPSIYTFSHRSKAGEGLISKNVLHNRTGFEDGVDAGNRRLLYRVRYLEPVGM